MVTHSRKELLDASRSFCNAFANKSSPDVILAMFSTEHAICTIEHGLSRLAPFLGRLFEGREGVQSYFEKIGSLLSYENMAFSEYVVDPQAMKVSVKGTAIFTWDSTKQSWAETFTYTLDFDDDLKLVRYQVWADSGAAHLASQGMLTEGRKQEQ